MSKLQLTAVYIPAEEGGRHSIYKNMVNGYKSSIPHHTFLKKFTCIQICKQLEIESPF